MIPSIAVGPKLRTIEYSVLRPRSENPTVSIITVTYLTMYLISQESIADGHLDRALLAAPHQDRQWQASHGLTRLSLPPRSQAQSSSYESHQAPGIESEHGLNFAQDLCKWALILPSSKEVLIRPSQHDITATTQQRTFPRYLRHYCV